MLLNHILSTSLITHCNTTIILIHLLLNVQLPIESTYNGAAETSKNGTTKTTLKGEKGRRRNVGFWKKSNTIIIIVIMHKAYNPGEKCLETI